MSKILFLDMDGVLNIMSDSYYSHSYLELGQDPIESHLLSRLEFIMSRVPDLKIVISSSWGYKRTVRRLTAKRFKYIDRIISEISKFQHRGTGIKQWLEMNNITNYVVVDDEVPDICGERCDIIDKDFVVEVDSHEGLSNKNCVDIISIINSFKTTVATLPYSNDAYDAFYRLGYRPHINVDNIIYADMEKEFTTIDINKGSLIMHLTRKEK